MRRGERIFSAVLFLFFLGALIMAGGYSPGVARMPMLIGFSGILLLIINLLFKKSIARGDQGAADGFTENVQRDMQLVLWIGLAIVLGYLLGLVYGLSLASILIFWRFFREKLLLSLIMGMVVGLVLHVVFVSMLGIVLFRGVIFSLFAP